MSQKIYIVGDGIVGRMTAITMHDMGFNVTIFNDKQIHKKSDRYFSINLLSKSLFEQYNIWSSILAKGVNSYRKIVTWDNLQSEEVIFESKNINQHNLAYVISESTIMSAINYEIEKRNSIKFENITTLNKNLDKSDYVINTINKKNLKIKSKKSHQINYAQKAVVMNIDIDNSGKIAYQKFLDGQILGLIPISTKTYNLIWSIDERKIDDLLSGTKKEMLNILNTELEEKTGTITDCSTYNLFPLSGYLAEDCFNDKIIHIGSSLHSIHPLAGLGLNMGLQDLFCLTSKIRKNSNQIDKLLLYEFQYFSNSLNKRTYYGINFLKKFYCDYTSPNLREVMLKTFNFNASLKNSVIRFATGLKTKDKINKEVQRPL